jgi:hypothetical protein
MKKTLLSLLAVACIAVASQMISCTPTKFYPVRTNEPSIEALYDSTRYRLNEIIVMFKNEPIKAAVDTIKAKIHRSGIDSATIVVTRKCNSCNAYVEVWHADSLHTRIHSNGPRAGTVSDRGSNGVGEDGLAYYSLNFKQNIPMDFVGEGFKGFNYANLKKTENNTQGKDVVRIAVLDTGIDTERILSTSYRWTNQREASRGADSVDQDGNCYIDDSFGWNFIGDNNDVSDNNEERHGTLVSHYIINEFATSRNKAVELMTLKTHDKDGYGDLFSSICAIHYAMENGAQIINASWGFYYYQDGPHPYLDYLITTLLREKGILFVAAAGNQIDEDDAFAHKVYKAAHSGVDIPDSYLRNLAYHNFYPACLSTIDNNVVTVTTADKKRVSPSQNYSSQYVDLGAIPDDINLMRFKVPYAVPAGATGTTTISGSSFAAAIVTGRIGAFLSNSAYSPNINKSVVLAPMEAAGLSTTSNSLASDHIRGGRITPHQ